MPRLTPVVELFAHARADLLADLGGVDRRVEAAADGKQPFELLQVGLDRRLHVRILKLAGERLPVRARARCTWPSEAAAAGRCSKFWNFFSQSTPSSAFMRRLTKAQPMGGASLCSFCNSAAYSGGSRSGMVAMSWATFISGPLRLPSAAASADASPARFGPEPRSRAPAKRTATPPTPAPTRA